MALNSVVGSLRVNLGLDTATFDRGMRRAERTVENFATSLGGMMAAGAAAAAAGLAALVGSSMNTAKEMRYMLSIADASPREFQRMAAAASSVGIEQDKMADILKDVQDRIGDFIQTGGGPMADFFNNIAPKVGVTADQFARLSGPEALQLFVSSMERANLTQEDMTFYMEALASDSTRLLPLLRSNAEQMNNVADAAEEFGGFFTQEDLDSINAANTQLGRVKTGLTALGNDITAALAPAMEGLFKFFADSLTEDGGLRVFLMGIIENMKQIAITAAVVGAAFVINMALAAGAVTALQVAWVALGTIFSSAIFLAAASGLGYLITKFLEAYQTAGTFSGAFQLLGVEIGEIGLIAGAVASSIAAMFVASKLIGIVQFINYARVAGAVTGSFATGLGHVTAGVLAANPRLAALAKAVWGVNAAMLANPVGLLVAALVAAGAALIYLINLFLRVSEGLGGMSAAFEAFKDVALGAVEYVLGLLLSIPVAVVQIGFGIAAAFASAFADILKLAIDLVNDKINAFEGFIAATGVILGSLVDFFANIATNAGNAFIDALGAALTKGTDMLNSILAFVRLPTIPPPDLSGLKDTPEDIKDVGAEAAAAFRGAFDDNLFGTETIEGFSKTAGDAFKNTFNRIGNNFQNLTGAGADRFGSGIATIQNGAAIRDRMVREQNGIPTQSMDDATRAARTAGRSLEDVQRAFAGTGAAADAAGAAGAGAMNNIAGGAGGAKDAVDELAQKMEERLQSNLEKMRDMFADTFTDIVTGTKSVRQGIADMLKDMARSIASSAFRDFFGRIFGVGRPGGNGFWGGVANFLFGGIGANADGTNNWRGGLTAINERGPEIVDLPSGTRIIPADLSRRMAMNGGGGAAVEIMLSQDLEGRILKEAENQSIRIVEGGIRTYDSQILPRRVSQVSNEPRKIG